ncbi:MAG TPA: DNA polymerase Y family protein [Tepidisphaeraceae bacterium]|nr:DNA polymerase Y family protein [Tepidisphaeraceae bacterium]
MVIVRTVAGRQLVTAASRPAMAAGVRPGLTLTEASALCPKLLHFDQDTLRDARALEALARWMFRFTPRVCLPSGLRDRREEGLFAPRAEAGPHPNPLPKGEGTGMRPLEPPAPPPPPPDGDCIYLDVTGCDRAFGGIDNLVAQVAAALAHLRLSAGIAVAPTPGAAWALASFASSRTDDAASAGANPRDATANDDAYTRGSASDMRGSGSGTRGGASDTRSSGSDTRGGDTRGSGSGGRVPIVTAHDLAAALSPLPVAGLRLDDDLLAALHHLGIETIAQVMNLPRSALPSRFGGALLLRLDQALGRIDEPLVPLPYHAPVEARMDFDGAVDSLETIHLVFRRLVDEVVADLARRGCGARQVEIEFLRAYAQTIRHTIGLSRPSRDAGNLFNLIRCATEHLDGGGDGFLGIRIGVPVFERVSEEQIALLGGERHDGEIELGQLLERLRVRLGDEAVATPVLVESHLPEKAGDRVSGLGYRVSGFGKDERKSRVSSSTRTPEPRNPTSSSTRTPTSPRPLLLLPAPVEIPVMVSPSEDRDGRPVLFRLDDRLHKLTHATGPERISGEWWRGHDKTRDYFDVEDEAGKRFWVFRVHETNRWYVHGRFG